MSVALFDARTPAREPHTPVISMTRDVHRAAPHELSDVCAHAGGAFVVCLVLSRSMRAGRARHQTLRGRGRPYCFHLLGQGSTGAAPGQHRGRIECT